MAENIALTIRQPWASLITQGVKDVENRSRPTRYRGRILIHAGLKTEQVPLIKFENRLSGALPSGAIIGSAQIVDCVQGSASEWAMPGYWHWILEDAEEFMPIPMRGQLGLWRVPTMLRIAPVML